MLKKNVLHSLMALLPKGQVFADRATLIAYEVDAGLDKGAPEGVVFPRSVEEVMLVARWASEYGVPLVARGSGTGLSGGAVADNGGLIMEFVHMHHILDVDAPGRSALVEPAMINLRLDERAKESGLYFPPDPASQRASTIGGNVAENAGGPHCFKYGVTTNYVTGMEVVLANGCRMQVGGRALDYPEYDFCGLLTGSEGMLGLMTSISVRLLRNPPAVKTLLAVFDSLSLAGDAVSAVISAGLVPATMEMMDQKIIRIIEPFAHANLPLDAGAVLIVEFDGYPESLDAQADEVVRILKQYGGHDMHVARDEEERSKIWLARKSAGGAIAREAPAYYTVDITVPRSRLTEMLTQVDKICTAYDLRFGQLFHAGDGNLHPMLLVPEPDDPDLLERVHAAARAMVKCCVDMGGSLSGEHGVGIEKRQFMSLMHKSSELLAMWDVKQVFDPQGLLNPGKVFPHPAENEGGPFAGYSQSQGSLSPASPTNTLALTGRIFTPTSAEEAAHYLQALSLASQAVTITGAVRREISETQLPQISTSALCGIKTYAPDDLYITVGSGTSLLEIQTFLAQHNKQLALSSPWSETTIGGLVAANVNAPQRMRYGAIRDNVLCATVALTDGRIIRTGRPLVKNVAGFDITKAFIGSYGTLGLLTDLSLKIMVQPRMKRSLLIPVHNLTDGLCWGQHMLTFALTASSILLSKGYTDAITPIVPIPQSTYLLSYTAEGMPEDVQAELAQVRTVLKQANIPEPLEIENVTGTSIWCTLLGQPGLTVVRAGVPLKDLLSYMQSQPEFWQEEQSSWIVDFGSGFVYALQPDVFPINPWLSALRQPALARTGYALVMSMPDDPSTFVDRWGYRPESLDVMRRLKARWDPQGILNPNAFVVDMLA